MDNLYRKKNKQTNKSTNWKIFNKNANSGLQLLILAENSSRLMAFLISKGTMLGTFPAKYFVDFNP